MFVVKDEQVLIKNVFSLFFFSRFNIVYKGTCHTTKVTRLHERTTYTFRISAIDDAGAGDYSPTVQYSTCTAPPPAIKREKIYLLFTITSV